MHEMNSKRAIWAARALTTFRAETRQEHDDDNEVIGDLICDIGHFCDLQKLDYIAIIARSIANWKLEQTDPESIESGPDVTISIGGHTPLIADVARPLADLYAELLALGHDPRDQPWMRQAQIILEKTGRLPEGAARSDDILMSADQWLDTPEFAGIAVLDADGWDRKNFERSWAEPIAYEEFVRRLCLSTTSLKPGQLVADLFKGGRR